MNAIGVWCGPRLAAALSGVIASACPAANVDAKWFSCIVPGDVGPCKPNGESPS